MTPEQNPPDITEGLDHVRDQIKGDGGVDTPLAGEPSPKATHITEPRDTIAEAQADLAAIDAALDPDGVGLDIEEQAARKIGQARLAQLGYENTRQRLLTLAQDIANVPSGLVDDTHGYCQAMIARAGIDPQIPRHVLDTLDTERRVYESLATFKDALQAIYESAQARSKIV